MKPSDDGAPPAGDVADLVNGINGWDKFRADLVATSTERFNSGYA